MRLWVRGNDAPQFPTLTVGRAAGLSRPIQQLRLTEVEGDYLALGRAMVEPKAGDLLAIMTAGAYGAVQSGTYNTRALVPEVLVKDDQYAVVRPRIDVDALIAMDKPAPWL